MINTEYLKGYRHPIFIIRFSILLHIYLSSRVVSILLFLLLRCQVSHKTVCEWTKKFTGNAQLPLHKYKPNEVLICHADEKYVKVKGEWSYWWSIKDRFGNVIHKIITPFRDLASAKKLFTEGRNKIGRKVDILIRDGLPAYDKAAKFLGRKCKSVIAGINGKGFLYKKRFYWVTNNPAESLNSEIDFYLSKFQNNFANLESANRFADIFMLQKYLKKCFNQKKLSEASSIFEKILCT